MSSSNVTALTSGRVLARNTLFSLLGELAPLILGLITVPILVRELGVDRYGVLTLSYLVVGYLGLFDLGLGRAVTQQISDALGSGDTDRIPYIFWTSLFLMLLLGVFAAAILASISHWLVNGILKIPFDMRVESVGVFFVLAASLPFVISGFSTSGMLAAFQRFDLITMIGTADGIYWFTAPLATLVWTHNLIWIVAVLVIGRLAAWCATVVLCLRICPALSVNISLSRKAIRSLLSFGGWITVSGVTGPMMVYFDRFIIGSMLSVAAVSYYAVAYQIVSKLGILPRALSQVLFPAFSATARTDSSRASTLFEHGARYAVITLFPLVFALYIWASEVLALFFGRDFASHSTTVMRWLLIGVFVNSLATLPFGLVQGANRPDLTAKLHVIELPIYLAMLFLLLPKLGLTGAAIAWTLRVAIDAGALYILAVILMPETRAAAGRIGCVAGVTSAVMAYAGRLTGLESKILYTTFVLGIFATFAWYRMIYPAERTMLIDKIHGLGFSDWASRKPAG